MLIQSDLDIDILLARWIEEDAHRPGPADARLREYGVAVWAIVGHLEGTGEDAQQTATDYDVPLEAVIASQQYFHRNAVAIDARRARNRAHGEALTTTRRGNVNEIHQSGDAPRSVRDSTR